MKTLLIGGTKQMLMLLMFVLTAFMLVTSGLRGEEVLPGREDARTCDTKSGQEGIDGCTRLIKLYPKFPLAYYNRWLHHSRNGELDLASDDLVKASKLSPDDGRAQNALSINEEARRKNDRALEGSLGGR